MLKSDGGFVFILDFYSGTRCFEDTNEFIRHGLGTF